MPYVPPVRSRLARALYAILAYVSLGIGIVAIFIPGLPTTEFVLLSFWAASRSSPRLANWLATHKLFGPMIENWHNGKRIARKAKIAATVSMLVCAVVMWLTLRHYWAIYAAIGGMVLVNLWIWSRPEPEV
ncbi:DUF454 family protein [Pseudomonas sp. NPDC007930]|uniref:YbaN family protein n=1 Tax=Pseudomonas sp. NPDC007930 TaxID=3364417 RepID=UPI0036E75382